MDATRPGVLSERALTRQLREAGLRATKPRLLVLDVLQRLGGHRSVDDIVAALRTQGTPLPRATVYNVIDALVKRGLVMGADTGPGRALFEASDRWHHHFVCRECGAVIDVACIVSEKPCLQPQLAGAEVDEAQIIFRGRCPTCAPAT